MNRSTMLNTTSEHALRALTHLARLPECASILGRELAEKTGVPANYLAKILWTLGNAGIIDATRGNHGGYRLKRHAAEIRLFEVVELFDRDRDGNREDPCSEHEDWRRIRQAYSDFLHMTTVADLSAPRVPNVMDK